MKKKLLIISYSPIGRDPRVMRQIRALQADYALTIVGFEPSPALDGIEFIPVSLVPKLSRKIWRACQLLAGAFEYAYWQSHLVKTTLMSLAGRTFDAVIANDVIAVPVALKLASGAPVIFDGHEYSPREFENSFVWRLFLQRYMTYLCSRYLPLTTSAMTVCQGIADEYKRHFGIEAVVVHNSPAYEDLPVHPTATNLVRLIHHGISARSRHLECMIDMMTHLDERFTLDLMLVNSDSRYYAELQRRAHGNTRIRFREPVPMEQISRTINSYDIGLFLLPPVNFNYHFALPNKFFEFIQARLAVAIGPSPEMSRLIVQYQNGVIAADFAPETLARALNALTPQDIEQMKRHSSEAAGHLNANTVTQQLRELMQRVLPGAASTNVTSHGTESTSSA